MKSLLKEGLITLAVAFGFAFTVQTAAFASFYIPSESMVPTLEVGDRLTASKFAYGWSRHSLPYDLTLPERFAGRLMDREPTRGDIVVFIHPRSGDRMIKRLIGLPGDRVEIRKGRLVLNGAEVARRFERVYRYREHRGRPVEVAELTEQLPGGAAHKIIERTGRIARADMAEITIPPGRYFMMGDNRDNSADSRFPDMGLVPKENLVARAEAILFSFYDCQREPGLSCADGRRFATRLR